MGKQSVGIRGFRDNLATYLLESTEPVTITKHGGVVGTFIPARRKRTEAEGRLRTNSGSSGVRSLRARASTKT